MNVIPDLKPDLAEAYNIVLNNARVLNGTSTGKSVSASPDLIPAGSEIEQWGERAPIDLPDEAGYFIFIDDYPGANWEHPCRYVFVDEDGETTVV